MKKLLTLACIIFYAMTAHAQSAGDYRNYKSGNWNTAIWQKYSGSSWVNVTTYPSVSDGAITIQDTTNVTINLSLTLDQVIVAAGGQLNLSGTSFIVSLSGTANALTVNGRFNWSAGTVNSTGKIIINGNLLWSGGNLYAPLTNAGTVSIDNNIYIYSPSVFTNNATVNWFGVSDLRFAAGIFNNNGIFNALGVGDLLGTTAGGTFNNNSSGMFNVKSPGIIRNANVTINNNGTMNIIAGTFFNYTGSFTNNKKINFAGGTYQNRATANMQTGTAITGTGTILVEVNPLNFNAASTSLPAGVSVYMNGGTLGGTGAILINGVLTLYDGSVSAALTINPSSIVYLYNRSGSYLYQKITNYGTINWHTNNIILRGGSISNYANFNIVGDNSMLLFSSTTGSFTNNSSGIVTKSSLGTTTISVPFINNGTIKGAGAFVFGTNLTNTAVFAPGVDTTTGILSTGTNYTNKTLSIKMKGSSPGLGFDRLLVNGNVTLGSADTLKVTKSGTVPAGTYTILISTGTITGNFIKKVLPTGYTVSIVGNKINVIVPAAVLGLDSEKPSVDNIMQSNKEATQTLLLFPNPAKQSIKISYALKNKSASVQIFNINGERVTQNVVAKNNAAIDISKLSPGMYVLQVNDGAAVQSAKFIKE